MYFICFIGIHFFTLQTSVRQDEGSSRGVLLIPYLEKCGTNAGLTWHVGSRPLCSGLRDHGFFDQQKEEEVGFEAIGALLAGEGGGGGALLEE